MVTEVSRVSSANNGSDAIGQARTREQESRGANNFHALPTKRYFVDPNDIESAIDRLSQLLAADRGGPRKDVPPGFYLNIIV